MTTDVHALESQLLTLSPHEQLRMARWLIDRAVGELDDSTQPPAQASNGLLAFAGRFSGGQGDTADHAEAILEADIDAGSGLSRG